MKKRGTILAENIIFIILNLIVLVILILFIWRQGEGAVIHEESYSKQISLLIDSAKPVMIIKLNMDKAQKISGKNKLDFENVVGITGNIVTVKLSDKGGNSYSFFNNVDVTAYPEKIEGEYTGNYMFTVSEKVQNE